MRETWQNLGGLVIDGPSRLVDRNTSFTNQVSLSQLPTSYWQTSSHSNELPHHFTLIPPAISPPHPRPSHLSRTKLHLPPRRQNLQPIPKLSPHGSMESNVFRPRNALRRRHARRPPQQLIPSRVRRASSPSSIPEHGGSRALRGGGDYVVFTAGGVCH